MEQSSIGQRIFKKRKELQLTQKELAKRLHDVSHSSVSQWESDVTKPNAENLFELSIIFACDYAWLLLGKGNQTNVIPANLNLTGKRIPLLSSHSLIESHNISSYNIIPNEYIMTDINVSNKSFALKVYGDAMEPDFIANDVIIIDPEVYPTPGEFVVAIINNTNIVFRKFKDTDNNTKNEKIYSLLPLNSDYAIISSQNNEIKILGTMVEHRIYRRKRKS